MKTVRCPECGEVNDASRKTCVRCGSSLTKEGIIRPKRVPTKRDNSNNLKVVYAINKKTPGFYSADRLFMKSFGTFNGFITFYIVCGVLALVGVIINFLVIFFNCVGHRLAWPNAGYAFLWVVVTTIVCLFNFAFVNSVKNMFIALHNMSTNQ